MYKLIAYYGDEVRTFYHVTKEGANNAARTLHNLGINKIYILKTDHVHNTKAL